MTTIISGISDISDDEYNVTAFESLSIIDSLHAAPRGGKSDDISILASSQSEYSNDYAYVFILAYHEFCTWYNLWLYYM